MSKLIWKLYNENMISEEVVHQLLDCHYNRVNNKNTNEYILFTP